MFSLYIPWKHEKMGFQSEQNGILARKEVTIFW